jgi:hypothetical protein
MNAGLMRGQVQIVEVFAKHRGVLLVIELCVAGAQDDVVGKEAAEACSGFSSFAGVASVLVVPSSCLPVRASPQVKSATDLPIRSHGGWGTELASGSPSEFSGWLSSVSALLRRS